MRIAIFGSAFNPAHFGHEAIVKYILDENIAENVNFVISRRHPFGKQMLPFDVRFELAQSLAMKFRSEVTIDDYHDGKTVPMIEELKQNNPRHQWMYIIGQDNADHIDNFFEYQKIINGDCCPFIVVPRGSTKPDVSSWYARHPHIFLQDFTPLNICSTDIRKALKSMDLASWRIVLKHLESIEKSRRK